MVAPPSVGSADLRIDAGGRVMIPETTTWPRLHSATTREVHMFKVLLVALVLFFVATFPATWLLMLFLGNVSVNVSYWGALPGGILLSGLLAGASSRSY